MTINHDTTTEALIVARDQIAATFANPFNSDAAVVFTVSIDGIVTELMRAPDIYEALRDVSAQALSWDQTGLGVFTTGWAAPLNPDGDTDGPPSEHPNRERVQLCAFITTDFRCVSIANFEGQDRELTSDDATGSLADAMSATLVFMLRRRFMKDDPD